MAIDGCVRKVRRSDNRRASGVALWKWRLDNLVALESGWMTSGLGVHLIALRFSRGGANFETAPSERHTHTHGLASKAR